MTIRVRADSRKRPRVIEDSDDEEPLSRKTSPTERARVSYTPPSSSDDDEGIFKHGPRTALSHIEIAPLIRPKSSYLGWRAPAPEAAEQDAIEALLRLYRHKQKSRSHDSEDDEHIEFTLDNFTIYQSRVYHYMGKEAEPTIEDLKCTLDTFRSKRGITTLFVDAVVSFRDVKYFIKRVPFNTISVEGYDDPESHGIAGIYIQTTTCKQHNIWLRLDTPAAEYARYHNDFLWVANLGKHVVDYMLSASNVALANFKTHFHQWLVHHHGKAPVFQAWLQSLRSTDFRVAINRHMQWLWSEALSDTIDTDGSIRKHPLWSEIDHEGKWLKAIPDQSSPLPEDCKTIVTPYVFDCFKNMYFGARMQAMKIKEYNIRAAHNDRKRKLGFPAARSRIEANVPAQHVGPPQEVRVGDVVGVDRDLVTKWQSKGSTWYLYVTNIEDDDEGSYYQGIWLYEPQDTTMGNMHYSEMNELFLSDHCNCEEEALIRKSDLIASTKVLWNPSTIPTSKHFIRQTYMTSDQSFRTLADDHLTCSCRRPVINHFDRVQQSFQIHDTVLVLTTRKGIETLEPRIIDEFVKSTKTVRVRRLLRAKRDYDCIGARANDLVWTSEFIDIKPQRIMRKCNIRFLLNSDSSPERPCIYDRDGQADCFLITKVLVSEDGSESVRDLPSVRHFQMTEGVTFENSKQNKPLSGLSLFCGGGNFDRGLEEGGAIHTKWAVEWDVHAAHTYRANLSDPEGTAIFKGSVDEHLRRALAGQLSATVPAIGKIDILLAGSPCQGFSSMQPQKMSIKSLTNASKIATVASYIDLWRPKYAILENVPEMARAIGQDKQENVFSQLLCCLVGMGYQVQQLLMDSWSYGEAQSRPRLFIIACAPGVPLLAHPNMTHAHPYDMPKKSLGKAPNGQPFGVRYGEPTIYPFVTAGEVTRDLPDIGDGATHSCLAFPDHRPGKITWPLEQELIRLIPKKPRNQGLFAVSKSKVLPKRIKQWILRQSEMRLSHKSHSYQRLSPSKLFRTITTALEPSDAKAGYGVHWDQNRVLTIMEGRRAQGFLDHEVILGNISTQWKIVGNSVSRAVALALGMSLRQAWLLTPTKPTDDGFARTAHRHASPIVVVDRQTPNRRRDRLLVSRISSIPTYIIPDDDDEPCQTTTSTSSDSVIERSAPRTTSGNSKQLQTQETTMHQAPDVAVTQAHCHSSLAIRLSQTPSSELYSGGRPHIIDLQSRSHTRDLASQTTASKAPGPTEQRHHDNSGNQSSKCASAQWSAGQMSAPVNHSMTRDAREDDEVIFVRSRIVKRD